MWLRKENNVVSSEQMPFEMSFKDVANSPQLEFECEKCGKRIGFFVRKSKD